MTTPVSVLVVANVIIEKAKETNVQNMSPLKLLKLVYIAHGFHLGLGLGPLFKEPIEAWQFGPVIPTLYHAVKKHGQNHVSDSILHTDAPSELTKSFVLAIYDAYKDFTAGELVYLTHKPGTPWVKIYKKNGRFAEIPNRDIENYYKEHICR